jgi:hypothetical protein
MAALPTTVLDASPSRERLGRVVDLLRGVEDDPSTRRAPARRARRPGVLPRPLPTSGAGERDH